MALSLFADNFGGSVVPLSAWSKERLEGSSSLFFWGGGGPCVLASYLLTDLGSEWYFDTYLLMCPSFRVTCFVGPLQREPHLVAVEEGKVFCAVIFLVGNLGNDQGF